MSPPHFPVRADELRGRWTFVSASARGFEFEGFTVHAEEIPHKGGRTFGFRVSDGRGVDRLHARPLPERARDRDPTAG